MKNRKRESCTSGTVRDEDGNILIYSARPTTVVRPECAGGVLARGLVPVARAAVLRLRRAAETSVGRRVFQ